MSIATTQKNNQRKKPDQAFLRPSDAMHYLGIGRTKLHFLSEQDPDFPRKIRLSPRCVGWIKKDIDAYLVTKSRQVV